MRKLTVFWTIGLAVLLLGRALAVSPLEVATTVESVNFAPPAARSNPSPVIAEYDYDLGLTNIGIGNVPDDCLSEGEIWEFWVKAHNAGYEVVDCAEIVFTINGIEIGRVHVAGLYPSEVRKYLFAFLVEWQQCEPFIIDAHVDWAPDENPDNNDIEDEFAVAGEPDTLLQRDNGVVTGAFCFYRGNEYPDFCWGSKWPFEQGGVIKYWEVAYTNTQGIPGIHAEFYVFDADQNGDIIDNDDGGILNIELQFPEIYWLDYGWLCYPICLPVEPSDIYYFGWNTRHNSQVYWCIDEHEDYPDLNWMKDYYNWHPSGRGGDWLCRVGFEFGEFVSMDCENLTPIFCRGKDFYFKLSVDNQTGRSVSGPMIYSGYAGYDCDPGNVLIDLVRSKTYPPGITEAYYYFQVPNVAPPGQYSASISGTLAGSDLLCCMNTDIIQCSPFRAYDNTEWQLVEVNRPEGSLATVTALHQNYPNPFNAVTNIGYNLGEAGNVTLRVYDITGRLVSTLVDEHQGHGDQTVTWDASDVSSGVYFCKLQTGGFSYVKKMNLLR